MTAETEDDSPPPSPPSDGLPGAPGWVATFADLMSLLLTFFVLIVATSTFDEKKVLSLRNSMEDTFSIYQGGGYGALLETSRRWMRSGEVNRTEDEGVGGKAKDSKNLLKTGQEKPVEDVVVEVVKKRKIKTSNEKLTPQLSLSVMFQKGQSKIDVSAAPSLRRMARLFKTFDYSVMIQGFPDEPQTKENFVGAWFMAARRAEEVCLFLVGEGIPEEKLFIQASVGAAFGGVDDPKQARPMREGALIVFFEDAKTDLLYMTHPKLLPGAS